MARPVATTSGRLFGRERDLAEIEAFLGEAREGRGRLLLISGEAGIGKTRLIEEASRSAGSAGMRVGWGRCWEGDGSPSYWPWIQILRSVLHDAGLEPGATDLGALAPDAGEETVAFAPGRARGEPARFRLFDTVAEALIEGSRDEPLLLVLDDLHWADAPSLSLLDFVARRIVDARVALVAAYRETDLDQGSLGELSRVGEHLRITGLAATEVGHLIAATAGAAVTPEVVTSFHLETGGNPFFVKELVRLLASQGDLRPLSVGGTPPIPDSVREVIQRRLARLSPACYEILAGCSVAGPELALEVVGPVVGVTGEELLESLAEAVEAGILVEDAEAVGRYRFSHTLVRATLYEVLGSARRRALHGRVGRALEELHAHNVDPVVDRLAHHFVQASPLGEAGKAVDYSARAGDRANASFGYEEAAEHYRRGLQAHQLGPTDDRRRCELLVSLGGALWRGGDGDASRQAFAEAAGLARGLLDPELFAQAALGYGLGLGGQGYGFRADETFVALLWEALAMLGPADSVPRVRVLGRLAAQLHWTDHAERAVELSLAAVEAARRLGQPRILLEAHFSSPWGLATDSRPDERLAEADRILLRVTGAEDREMMFWGQQLRLVALAESGDARGVRAAIEACAALAEGLRVPHYRWQVSSWKTGLALMEGRIEEAETLASETLRLGEHVHPDEPMYVFGAHMGVLRWLQGRFEELEPALRGLVNTYPGIAAWRGALVWLLVEVGREDDARAELESLAAQDFADLRRDPGWLVVLWDLSLPCAVLGDAARAEILHRWLEAHEDRNIVVGGMAFNFGSTALPLALLESAMGRWDEAERHFEMAQERNADFGNVPMGVVARREHAAMLLARAAPGDEGRARELLARAMAVSRDRGLAGIGSRITRLAEVAGGVPGHVQATSASGAALVLEGEHWAVSFSGSTVRLKDLKGMRDLARLLAAPGRELHVFDLLGGGVHEGAEAAIDDRARDEYKARLLELRRELEEAEDMGDAGRAERARAEAEALEGALASAYGLGGRARRAGDSVERARKAVTWRIRSVLSRIEELEPRLGRHLRASVRTGIFCSYDPVEPVEWTVRAKEPANPS